MYADDTKCGTSISRCDNSASGGALQDDTDAIFEWSLENRLQLHEGKTFTIQFHSPKCEPINTLYHLNSNPISIKEWCKDLGVLVSSDLSWSQHINHVIAQAYRSLFLIKRVFPSTSNIGVKKRLYLSLVLPILTYCFPVWRPYSLGEITKLERVQKRATKYILNDSTLPYKERLSQHDYRFSHLCTDLKCMTFYFSSPP